MSIGNSFSWVRACDLSRVAGNESATSVDYAPNALNDVDEALSGESAYRARH